ncbi:MAG TPA: hypothetical protein VFS78_13300 [Vicinamibacteria bacterium]|nr:hypothetical protein [Vicinamibacteria bacterium]
MLLVLETERLTLRRIGPDDAGFERVARFTAEGPELRVFARED